MRKPTKKHPEAGTMYQRIAAAIRNRRLEMGLSQNDFAKLLHVTQATVSVWESGKHNFSISLLMYICEKTELRLSLVF